MRFRPVRPNIYLPVIRFGVLISDWKYILAATLVGYLMPFFFRLKFGFVPLWFLPELEVLLARIRSSVTQKSDESLTGFSTQSRRCLRARLHEELSLAIECANRAERGY